MPVFLHILIINLDVWDVENFGSILSCPPFATFLENPITIDHQILQWSCTKEVWQWLWAKNNIQVLKAGHYCDIVIFFLFFFSNLNLFFSQGQRFKGEIFQIWEYYYFIIFLLFGFYSQKFNTHFLQIFQVLYVWRFEKWKLPQRRQKL